MRYLNYTHAHTDTILKNVEGRRTCHLKNSPTLFSLSCTHICIFRLYVLPWANHLWHTCINMQYTMLFSMRETEMVAVSLSAFWTWHGISRDHRYYLLSHKTRYTKFQAGKLNLLKPSCNCMSHSQQVCMYYLCFVWFSVYFLKLR